MKKRIFPSLILASCLFVTSVANAGDIESFSKLYPAIARFNNDAIISRYFLNNIAVTSAMNSTLKQGKFGNDKDVQRQIVAWQKEVDCLESFANTGNNKRLQNQLLKKIPATELQAMEQFLQTPQGQKMYSLLEDLIKSAKTGDFDKVDNFEKNISKSDKEAIATFNQQHLAMIDSMDKVISSKQAETVIENYRQTCQSSP